MFLLPSHCPFMAPIALSASCNSQVENEYGKTHHHMKYTYKKVGREWAREREKLKATRRGEGKVKAHNPARTGHEIHDRIYLVDIKQAGPMNQTRISKVPHFLPLTMDFPWFHWRRIGKRDEEGSEKKKRKTQVMKTTELIPIQKRERYLFKLNVIKIRCTPYQHTVVNFPATICS